MVSLADNITTYIGDSNDSKPTEVLENSMFLERDTGIVYYFDGSAWQVFGGSEEE